MFLSTFIKPFTLEKGNTRNTIKIAMTAYVIVMNVRITKFFAENKFSPVQFLFLRYVIIFHLNLGKYIIFK